MQTGQIRPAGGFAGGNKSKMSIHKRIDRHTTLASLLLRADLAPDPLERLLAVTRTVLAFALDIFRPGQGLKETPVVILGQHVLSHRDLAEKHCGDAVVVMLQEICSHFPEARPAIFEDKNRGPEALHLGMKFIPTSAVKAHRSTLGPLGGGSSPPFIEVTFKGQGTVVLPRHDETYTFTLPALRLMDPLSAVCPLELAGSLGVACAESGLLLTLKCRESHAVKGSVTRKGSDARVASFSGHWTGGINVDVQELGASGTVYNARQLTPPLATWINLAEPGPRRLPRVWAAIIEGLYYLDAQQAAAYGKKAEQLTHDIIPHLKHALLYQVAEGIKARKPGQKEEERGLEVIKQQEREIPLPLVIRKARAEGRSPAFQLLYSLQTVAD